LKTIFSNMAKRRPQVGILFHALECGLHFGQIRNPLVLILILLLTLASAAEADPEYGGHLLYGLDPVITTTDNPRLLGVERLVMRRRLIAFGVDPLKDSGKKPQLIDSFRKVWLEKSNVDLQRKERLVEYNRIMGLVITIEYPKFFYLFPAPETLPGGIIYYPPRPVTDSVVKLFVDDIEAGGARTRAVDRVLVRDKLLGGSRVGQVGQDDGLINLTIPIKLPRTLEKIIGRGEKTRIKITGRDRISFSGESKVINPFTPTERVTSQSLFPSLDMEQELQVNLSGNVGEKIIIEVDHNSAQIGPDATNIKLMYQGGEDEIIKTIETGDVGLTLPGSRLLGYSSNKSGLFGIKVTGQMGRAEFTTVVSKQKAESSSKSFNSTGGEVEDNIIYSHNYLNHRFFRLDLPESPYYPVSDFPGRAQGYKIDIASIKVFKMMGTGVSGANDVDNVAVYVDTTGVFWNSGFTDIPADFAEPNIYAARWRETEYDLMLDVDGELVALDMRQQMLNEDVLGVIYNVVDSSENIMYRVGDRPGTDVRSQALPDEEGLYYRMKLLKASVNKKEPFSFYYVLRNIYSLGGANIDIDTFDLKIERNETNTSFPDQDENNIPYIRIFGLDSNDPQNSGNPDDLVDKNDNALFDLRRGLLKFPLDFPSPFNAGEEAYADYANDGDFEWEGSFLQEKQAPELYDKETLPSNYQQYGYFRLVASHAATASNFNLGVSNIEEGSETVTLDGRTLTRGVDYEIDYTFGQLELKGDASNLTSDSKVSVTYQYAPFFGGGQTNLLGLNLDYDLGRESTFSTTWLYQSESIVGEKAKLGEEPSKTLVGNVILGHTFKPYFLTHLANFVSLRNTERESSLQFNAEAAVSLPNPNTKGQVFLEDFEGVDASDIITLTRIGWTWGAQPFLGERHRLEENDTREFIPENRVKDVRWFTPKERTERYMLNPTLENQERGETQQVMDLYLKGENDGWSDTDWGGITRGISRTGQDLSKAQFIEIWVNDGRPDKEFRTGKLHIDFGYINEDGFWNEGESGLIIGRHDQEDGILPNTEPDGIFSYEEDIGLDGDENGPQKYSAEYGDASDPYPNINGTARNNREDNEDINRNSILDRDNGYFTTVIDLKETEALVDVIEDYRDEKPEDVIALENARIAWRKYRIPITEIDTVSIGTQPNIQAVTHVRLWFEDPEWNDYQVNGAPVNDGGRMHMQLSEFKFLGSRWEREGVRRTEGEVLLTPGERLVGEEFFLGEVNNKENADYIAAPPPFEVNKVENIEEKEQSLVLEYSNLAQGHMVLASKQVSPQGDDYTPYREMTWYWYNPKPNQADVDLFFRVGSDTLNYYEVNYNFANSPSKTGWKTMAVNLAELSNVKNGLVDENDIVHGTIKDSRSSDNYAVRVVGRPDLRKVRRFYWVVANNNLSEDVSGYFYLNDVKLEGVKTKTGLAQSVGVRLNMADVIKVDFDWGKTDAEFHGLDKRVGSGQTNNSWSLSANLNVDDFIPLAGFKLPIRGSRQQNLVRPKYETNSDIEILDQDTQNLLSTIETQERFSARLNHAPSKGALLRYMVDPWVVSTNGSQSTRRGPQDEKDQKTLSGSLNYDLRIPGNYSLGDYPILKYVPLVKGVNIVPSKIALGAVFSSSYSASKTIAEDGSVSQRPTTKSRPSTLTANLDYDPLQVLNLSLSGTSERDLLREYHFKGVNIGTENRRRYEVRMTVVPPLAKSFPSGKLFYPLRAAANGLKSIKPSIQFTGAYSQNTDPSVPQTGDPVGTKNISNNNRWDVRMSVPVGDIFQKVFPEKKYSVAEKNRLIEEQARLNQQQMRRGRQPGQDEEVKFPEEWAELPPDERARLEEEFLLEQAEERMAQERENTIKTPVAPEKEAGPSFNLTTLYNVLFNPLRQIKPVKFTVSEDRSGTYGRIHSDIPFWYKAGFQSELDTPDSTYVSSGLQYRQTLSLSSSTQIVRSVSLDVKYSQKLSDRVLITSSSKGYQQDWPDASIVLSGLEKWRIFGGGGEGLDSGWFRSSNFNLSYKRSKTVNNITPISYNPSYSKTINPRLTFTFHSGLNATLTSTLGNDYEENNGVITENNRMRFGVQVSHQFKAQEFLAKLGLYRPGSNPSIKMDIDVSYSKDKKERFNPGSSASTPTGMNRINAKPRFSYQVTRNLSGAVFFSYGRSKDLASNITTTSLGLGVEATFVF
jgi:Motility related/secretion protein